MAKTETYMQLSAVERLSSFDIKDMSKTCTKLLLASSELENNYYNPSIENVNTFTLNNSSHLQVKHSDTSHFEARLILNGELYDNVDLKDFELKTGPRNMPSFNFHMTMNSTGFVGKHSFSTPIVKVLPGYKTNVTLEACLQRARASDGVEEDGEETKSKIQIKEKVNTSPWMTSQVETMLVFGRVGYRLQYICGSKREAHKKISLELKYPNICKEISAVHFKSNGESDIVQVVFDSEEMRVAPGTKAILEYIRDNVM